MIPLYHPARVRELDARAMADGVDAMTLMERAAGAVARAVTGHAGRGYGLRVALLCGKGNNGGDGLAAARRLLRAGASPVVWLSAEREDLSPQAQAQLRRWLAAGGRVAASPSQALDGADIAVDCLLGTGAGGAPRGVIAEAIAALHASAAAVVACDLPSGVDAATGAVPAAAVRADVTVTLGAEKLGLRLWPARGRCGRLVTADIGVLRPEDQPDAVALEDADVARLLPPPAPDSEKRTRGVVLVVAGSPGMAGAALLTARGALAAGAGLVTVAAAESVVAALAHALPEALTLALPADAAAAAKLVLERAAESDAVALGPGRGVTAEAVEVTRRLVGEVAAPLVLDADGLNAFRHDGDALVAHASSLLVLTPHRRELERLAGADGLWDARAEEAPRLAARWGAVLAAKGPGTLVAAPDGRRWVNATGGAALATGGTGDVLAGMLAAFLAQSPRVETVPAAVHMHGLAGQLAGERRGTRSAGPLDVAGALAGVLRGMEGAG